MNGKSNFSRKCNVRCRSLHNNCQRGAEECRSRRTSAGCRHIQGQEINNDGQVEWSSESTDHVLQDTLNVEQECETESVISSSECEDIDGDGQGDNLATLQVQEIWQKREILETVNALPGSQEVAALVTAGKLEEAAAHPNSSYAGLLLSSYLGNNQLLTLLMAKGFPVNVRDSRGRTPLHLAACVGAADCIETLIRHNAIVNVWDDERVATPLHCAASAGSLPSLRLLIAAGASVQAGVSSTGGGKPPLHYAVQSNSISCVQELIKHGAAVNTPQVYTETPLHVAAAMGFSECLKILLDNGADTRVRFGPGKSTPLHLAAEDGNAKCAKLLLDGGAELHATNGRQQSPLHLAALAQSAKTLEMLLISKADPNAEDVDKRTPLHCAIVKGSRSCECVQLLLQYGARVNAADIFGYTPVHIAALNEFSTCLKILLDHGGDVTKKTNGHVSALSFIARRTPEVLQHIQGRLDHAIKLHDHEIGDVDCEVKLDFRILVPNMLAGETGLLLTFIEVGQRRLLKHPLCETFLHLKWRRIRKYFVMSLFIHAIYVILCSLYIVEMFLNSCTHLHECVISTPLQVLNYILLISNLGILGKELFQIAHTRKGYVYQWENWLQWFIIIMVFITLLPPSILTHELLIYQHHISVFGIFFNWIELMVLLGRFPMFGLYVQMFTTGAVNFGKFLLAYCCLLAGFAFSFMMLFPRYKAFTNIFNSMVKTVVMMTGELEFEEIFFEDDVTYPGTAHLFFLIFTLIVTMVLTNLLVGLSVSDIQGLQKSAGLDRLVRQAELVAYMESMLFSRLLHWIPKKLLAICHKSALLFYSTRQYTLIIRPNDPRENRIPQDLVKSAYRLVSERRIYRYHHSSHRSNSSRHYKRSIHKSGSRL